MRIVKQQAHGNAAQLGVLVLAQLFIERVVYPAIAVLHLAGDGEFVILLRQALAVLLHDLANRYPAYDRGCQCQTFEHGDSFRDKKKRTRTDVVEVRCEWLMGMGCGALVPASSDYCCTRNRRLPGLVSE